MRFVIEVVSGVPIHAPMAIHRFKPTPRQEWMGRSALVVLGLLFILGGIELGRFCMKVLLGIAEFADMDDGSLFYKPLAIVSLFLLLVGVVLIGMAFLPGRDTRRGPLRGFPTVSRVFDRFWGTVREIMR